MIATRRASLGLAALAVAFVVLPAAVEAKPNVLIIYADDLGWAETGAQGCKDIPTPHIDSIAQGGVRFTQGYVAATYCSPSRAGLMSGHYPTRFGHEYNAVAQHSGLALSETTLADRLKSLGYATCIVGKWHLGGGPEYRPTKRGFDEFYGTLANTSFYHPVNFVDSRVSDDVQKIDDDDFYTTDKYADRAVDWLAKQQDKPWFLYLPFNALHAPLQAPQKYLDRFPNITDEKRKIFAGMMAGMDDAIGRVLGQIRMMGQEQNTIVYFIGDNGGPTASTTSNNLPLHGFKMTTWEGGPRVPFFAQWKGTLPEGKVYDNPVLNLDLMPTLLTAAGAKVDPSWKLDGVDLVPYVTGKITERPHETLYWRCRPQWAVRHGDWKLVVARGGSGQPELYNLADDISESKNLASAEPERVAQLQKLYDAWDKEQAEPTAVDSEKKAAKKANRPNGKRPGKRAAKKPAA